MRDFLFVVIITAAIAVSSCAFGMVLAYRSLEHIKVTEVIDGKEEVHITLVLGQFRYVITVPERRDDV